MLRVAVLAVCAEHDNAAVTPWLPRGRQARVCTCNNVRSLCCVRCLRSINTIMPQARRRIEYCSL